MKLVKTLAALSLISCVAACAPSGYYDANGQYHAYGQNDTYRNNNTMSNTASADSANGYTVGDSAGSPPYG